MEAIIRYRLGFNISPSSSTNHTICIEQFFTDSKLWNRAQISINGTGISLQNIHTTKYHQYDRTTEYHYTKTIVQLKNLIAPIEYLYYTTHLGNENGDFSTYPSEFQLAMTVYGIHYYQNDIGSSIYDFVEAQTTIE